MTEALDVAAEQLADDDPSGAYDTINGVLEYPAQIDASALPDALDVLARATNEIFGEEWGDALAPAAAAADDATALGAAGSFLVGQGFAGLAITVLTHAQRCAPTNGELLAELVTAYEQLGDHAGAVRAIDDADAAANGGFLPQYLLAYNSMMAFDTERAREVGATMRGAASDEAERFMVSRIEGMLARFDAIAAAGHDVAPNDLQVWHLVRTGGLLLDVEHNGDWPDGRKKKVDDSVEHCCAAIGRVDRLLAALGVSPRTILTVPDDSSAVLAAATAALLRLPAASWPDDPDASGMVVVYDIERLADHVAGALAIHAADQILWSHADRWTIDQRVTPDIVSFVHQEVHQAWAADLHGQALPDDAVTRWSDAIVAASTNSTESTDHDAVDRIAALAEATRGCGDHAAGVFRTSGRREKQFMIPVPPQPS